MSGMINKAVDAFRATGATHPFGAVEADAGVAIYQTNGLPDLEAKRSLMNAMRLASNDMSANRSALCYEGWTISTRTPTSKAILARLQADGRSIKDHPEAVEALFISVESDAGVSTRVIPLSRSPEGIAFGTATDDFAPGPDAIQGEMTGFHVTPAMRSDPQFAGYLAMVRFVIERQHEGALAN